MKREALASLLICAVGALGEVGSGLVVKQTRARVNYDADGAQNAIQDVMAKVVLR